MREKSAARATHRNKTTNRELHTVHGNARKECSTAEYEILKSAKARCENPRNPGYKHYGGRGIRFKFGSFAEALAEIGRRPNKELTLDRIDNDGHYEPGNVRWATRSQQALNRRPKKNFRKLMKAANERTSVTGAARRSEDETSKRYDA